MNKNKRPLPKQLKKQMQKEVRNAQRAYTLKTKTEDDSDLLTAKELAKKFPKKPQRVRRQKNAVASEKKGKKIPSKRTSPGLVSSHSSPAHVHPEGKRWIKTLNKQTKNQRVIQRRQRLKRGTI